MQKHWIEAATNFLFQSLGPVPHEINEIDWKSDLSTDKARTIEHLIAFANHPSGGFLAFGIRDNDAKVLGIQADQIKTIMSKLNNLARQGVEPPLTLDHAVVDIAEKKVLLVFVREQSNKPAHRRGATIEETWIRSGGTTRKASRQEIGALMLHSQAPRWEEMRASPLLRASNVIEQLDIATIAKLRERPLPSDEKEIMKWLEDEKIVIPDGDGYYITNFGAISAARDLEQFETLKRKRIRVIRYKGLNKIDTIEEKVGHKGYASGFEGLIKYLKTILPHSEIIKQSLREEVSVYPEIALRELIANALIHQDFNVTGAGPMIEIFDDRIEFTNPGTLLGGKKLDRLIGTTPQSRNEILASSFRLYRICEERGTGFQKVVAAVEIFGMPPVGFAVDDSFRVTLHAPRKFSDMSQTERIEACYQHAVLQFLSSQTLTNKTLRERFKLHDKQRTQISNLITEAVEANRIKRKETGSGNKFAEYLPYWA